MDLLPRLRAVGLALAALVAATIPATPARADLADGFGVRPVVPPGATTPPAYFRLEVHPGQTLTRSVVTSNGSKRPLRYRIDPVDGLTGNTSGVVYANRQDRLHEAGTWLRIPDESVTLAPGATRRLRFQIHVPKDARPGDHLAGLAFEDTQTSESRSRFSVKQVVRVVMGVQLTIAGGKRAQIEVSDVKLRSLPGTQVPAAVVRLANLGDQLCKPRLRVELTSGSGERSVSDGALDTILAHDRIPYPLVFDGPLEAGRYGAVARVSGCGAPREASTTAVLKNDLSGATDAPASLEAPDRAAALPTWAAILIGALGATLLLVLLLWLRDRRKTDA